ncbi:hypothetical protein AVEN_259933-1 [Araneus ventricosus]|uniref:Uncharacterized protein n=1 Tax=Araneus ventricosus TaxID=182803 RepID=A0A4Y2GQD8_ARAVE|nr:hypothetical protein AVEN_259933-1 [Araneus ventricosus]
MKRHCFVSRQPTSVQSLQGLRLQSPVPMGVRGRPPLLVPAEALSTCQGRESGIELRHLFFGEEMDIGDTVHGRPGSAAVPVLVRLDVASTFHHLLQEGQLQRHILRREDTGS